MRSVRKVTGEMWVRSEGDYRRLEGTREVVGDQRNILLSMTQKYHHMKTG
jgi:hypothetical protein